MPLHVGCDIVDIGRFQTRFIEGGTTLCERLFHPAEYTGKPASQLAGTFAAKEAVCKALSIPAGHWLDIVVEHEPAGAPKIVLLGSQPLPLELSISISHDGGYAVAFAVALLP